MSLRLIFLSFNRLSIFFLISSSNKGAELPTQMLGDPTRINQMITNLASNSIKFTKEGEVSILFYQRNKKQWAMEVTDTGPGIPKKSQKDIFEPFRQADGTIARKYGGTGLGLSIVKHLTTMMDGKIKVKSKVGVGSTFTITLPIITRDGNGK